MMNIEKLSIAIEEAKRFLGKAEIAMSTFSKDYHYGGPETAACKRASLDLTKALANIRK